MIVHKHRGRGVNHLVRTRHHNGEGVMDIFKSLFGMAKTVLNNPELTSKISKTATEVFNIGKNTKDIITSVREKKETRYNKKRN